MWQNRQQISLALVDDHPVILQGLKSILKREPRVNITGTFTTGTDFLAFLEHNTVQVVLLDISLPDSNGTAICRKIKQVSPETSVLAFSNHTERVVIMQMLQSGASGYLLKNVPPEELLYCMEEAICGQLTFSAEVKKIMASPAPHELKVVPPLTKREKQVLQLVADGKTNPDIAATLSLSILTIETHRRNLMQKLEVKNAAALIKTATLQQLL